MNIFFFISLVALSYSCVAIRSCAADDGAGDDSDPQVTIDIHVTSLIKPDNIKCIITSGLDDHFSEYITGLYS